MNIQFKLKILWLCKYICLYFNVLNFNSEFLKGRGLLVVTYKMHYVGTTFTLKMNSNDKILRDNIVNKQHLNVLKIPEKFDWSRSSPTTLNSSPIWVIGISLFFHIGRLWGFKCRCQALFMLYVFLNPQFKLIYMGHAEIPLNMNTASKLGPHTQTDRGTCPGVGLWVYFKSR